MALKLAQNKGTISKTDFRYILQELELIPGKVEKAFYLMITIKEISNIYKDSKTFFTWVEAIIFQ